MALISIIVPVYNVEDYLERCIVSIQQQTYSELEIILVDDGSTDSSGKICDEYKNKDSRIRVFHKKNGGLSDARNLGIEVAKGDFFAFIDSDDWIDIDMLEVLYKAVQKYDADIAECSFRCIYKDHVEEETANTGTYIEGDNIFALQCEMRWKYFKPIACNKLYRRYIFKDVCYPVGRLHEDEFTTHKAFYNASKLVYVDLSKYNYDRTREESITASFKEKNLDVCDALKERVDFFKKKRLTSLVTEMEDLYFCVLLDRLYKCYKHGIKTERVTRLISETRNNYFVNMELDINAQNKFELSLLQTSYKWFVRAKESDKFREFVNRNAWFFVGEMHL